ncbi:MAG: DUF4037 domain-containing protein [Brevefilum sp.]
MPEFIPGLELSKCFYQDAIQPLLASHFPDLAYSAARLSWGSDVLGFDTPMSMDHGWGPKMTFFLKSENFETIYESLDDFFANQLPLEIRGFPTHFAEPYADGGVMEKKEKHPIHHMIKITTVKNFFHEYIGLDIEKPISPADWLTLPQQKLRTLRSGQIYHDSLGLEDIRESFRWYPHDLWLYLMACSWRRIDQEAPFVGRAGSVDDELGSSLVAARLVKEIMQLGFLLSKVYAPYAKWFGTAFDDLGISLPLSSILWEILNAESWRQRERALGDAYMVLMEYHANLKIPEKSFTRIVNFYNRPFHVPPANDIAEALLSEITDPDVRRLPQRLGNVNQISDNTDLLEDPQRCRDLIGGLLAQEN